MLLSWLLYLSTVSFLLGLAAWALDRIAGARAWPTRGVWSAAVFGTLAVGAIAWLGPSPEIVPTSSQALQPTVFVASGGGSPVADEGWGSALPRLVLPGGMDRPAGYLWLLLSTGLLAVLVLAQRRLARLRRGWQARRIDGHPVLLSEGVGPAVVGLVRPRIVLPRWALDMPAADLRLMLRHEEEHCRARDPRLLAAGLAALALLPWNAPLWWLVHRLRNAIETDCDRRVLAGEVELREYADLLVRLGERRLGVSRLGSLAFARSRPNLKRRLETMTAPRRRGTTGTVLMMLLLATSLTGACLVEQLPTQTAPPESTTSTSEGVMDVRIRSESSRTVIGSVVHRGTEEPVPEVVVEIPGTELGAISNQEGRFLILGVPPGEHELLVTHADYGQQVVIAVVVDRDPEPADSTVADRVQAVARAGEEGAAIRTDSVQGVVQTRRDSTLIRTDSLRRGVELLQEGLERIQVDVGQLTDSVGTRRLAADSLLADSLSRRQHLDRLRNLIGHITITLRERDLVHHLSHVIDSLSPLDSLALLDSSRATGTVLGQVVHPATGEPLASVEAVVSGTELGAVTNREGRFLILGVGAGTRTLVFRHPDWNPVEVRVEVVGGGTADVGTVRPIRR